MSISIVPSIIGETFAEVRAKFEQIDGVVPWVQIDVVDGLFATPASWPYKHHEHVAELRTLLQQSHTTKVEMHLMIESPESEVERWLASGASRVLFHAEATDKMNDLLTYCETPRIGLNAKGKLKVYPRSDVGVVLNLATPVSALDHLAHAPHVVQVMSIARIGSYGGPFDEAVFPKIKYLRRKYPHATISVDGGVRLENARELVIAGATQLVVGSAVWNSKNPRSVIKELQRYTA